MAEYKGGDDVSSAMTICKPAALKDHLKPGECLLGLDVGSKTIGIAISDRALIIASPLTVIQRTKFTKDADSLWRLILDNNVGALCVGLPVEMNGTEGRQAQSVRTFVDNFQAIHSIPVAFWDERLSTVAVERMMIQEADLSRRKRAKTVDRAAAAFILQGALEAIRQ
jgi:putative Holliday junction resolvase